MVAVVPKRRRAERAGCCPTRHGDRGRARRRVVRVGERLEALDVGDLREGGRVAVEPRAGARLVARLTVAAPPPVRRVGRGGRQRRRRASAARVQHPDLELLAAATGAVATARRHARRRVVERVVQPARAELRRCARFRIVIPAEAAHRVIAGEREAGDDRRHVALGDKVFLRRPQQCLAFGGGGSCARPRVDDPVARDVTRRLAVGGVCQVVDHRPALRRRRRRRRRVEREGRRIEGRRVEGPS